MDAYQYLTLKESGKVWVQKVGPAIAAVSVRYDPITGAEQEPEAQYLRLADFEAERDRLAKKLDNINALIDDLKALEK